jgi:hypothetical protein
MSKRQEGNPMRERLAAFAHSLTLTWQEQAMVAILLVSMLVGAMVMYYRREYRLQHPAAVSPAPRQGVQSAAGG